LLWNAYFACEWINYLWNLETRWKIVWNLDQVLLPKRVSSSISSMKLKYKHLCWMNRTSILICFSSNSTNNRSKTVNFHRISPASLLILRHSRRLKILSGKKLQRFILTISRYSRIMSIQEISNKVKIIP